MTAQSTPPDVKRLRELLADANELCPSGPRNGPEHQAWSIRVHLAQRQIFAALPALLDSLEAVPAEGEVAEVVARIGALYEWGEKLSSTDDLPHDLNPVWLKELLAELARPQASREAVACTLYERLRDRLRGHRGRRIMPAWEDALPEQRELYLADADAALVNAWPAIADLLERLSRPPARAGGEFS